MTVEVSTVQMSVYASREAAGKRGRCRVYISKFPAVVAANNFLKRHRSSIKKRGHANSKQEPNQVLFQLIAFLYIRVLK